MSARHIGGVILLLLGLAAPVSAKPDLTVTKITLEPANALVGEGNVHALITNQGSSGTSWFTVLDTHFLLDGELCHTATDYAGLGAGKTTTQSTDDCNPSTPGTHVITVIIDPENEAEEANEDNNSKAQPLIWMDPEICNVAEKCNGLDDNCNGETDEIFTLMGTVCDSSDPDDCALGLYVCSPDGSGVVCAESTAPMPELCNNVDDDCDGQIDEDFPGLGQPCSVMEDDCTINGTLSCTDGGGAVYCAGTPTASAEICNGLDDDCDGTTDEDFTQLGQPCAKGIGACRTTGTISCFGDVMFCASAPEPPGPFELCGNREDDNCNGLYDEGCPCEPGQYLPCGTGVGACHEGLLLCIDGELSGNCQGATLPLEEVCGDGEDNNCDGSIDEGCSCPSGTLAPCSIGAGGCTAGKQTCSGGAWGPCIAEGLPTQEKCDGIDNDCDGSIDEGCPCEPGTAVACTAVPDDCAFYGQLCGEDSTWFPCMPKPGTEEIDCGEGGGDASSAPPEDTGPIDPPSNVGKYTPPPGGGSTGEPSSPPPVDAGCRSQSVPTSAPRWTLLLGLLLVVARRTQRGFTP
jgi:hypothetical protein